MSSHRFGHDEDLLHDSDDDLAPADARNPHAKASRWRHQESSGFARYAAGQKNQHHVAREPEARGGRVDDLANFLNSTRVSPPDGSSKPQKQVDGQSAPRFKPIVAGTAEARNGSSSGDAVDADGDAPDGKEIAVGPLLNYRRMEGSTWVGSVLVVTKGGGKTQSFVPTLALNRGSQPGEGVNGAHDGANGAVAAAAAEIEGFCLYSDPRNTFWRFDLHVPIGEAEARWEYTLPGLRFASKTKPQRNAFYVPAISESFRIMFHSCNGFSVGTDEDAWSGGALWNDVLRCHNDAPFHVMLGGGDQIYNDGIRVAGPLRAWTDISNPRKRKEYPFPEQLRHECDDYYLKNYIRCYGAEPFASANGQIPQLNIWDDHDIIDGFGSYVNEFMKCDVFRGIGGTAHKYYMLFQHHLPPPPSTYTSGNAESGQGVDPNQLADAYVHPVIDEPNYIVGSRPGPYVAERSYNMFARLGARIAFFGIDARTERTRHQVNYPETYDLIFDRVRQELGEAVQAGQPFKHIILLLGIPIAYPNANAQQRLTWLENVFTSPVMGPIKFMNKRFGLGGGLFNHFDGSIDLLDDLDDHYTARTHKKERNTLVKRLQALSQEFSARITILGGDVHLAALGRFYSKPTLKVPSENDHRYIVNVVSSAIMNKPPPQAIANLLARRNKIHHLNSRTDETLMYLFDKDPGDTSKTAGHNHVTMPSRNFAILTENSPNNIISNGTSSSNNAFRTEQTDTLAPPIVGNGVNGDASSGGPPGSSNGGGSTRSAAPPKFPGKNGHSPLHAGEANAGTKHKAASASGHGRGDDGSLDICIRVEIDQHDPEGRTEPYGLSVPALTCDPPGESSASAATRTTRNSDSRGATSATDDAQLSG